MNECVTVSVFVRNYVILYVCVCERMCVCALEVIKAGDLRVPGRWHGDGWRRVPVIRQLRPGLAPGASS